MAAAVAASPAPAFKAPASGTVDLAQAPAGTSLGSVPGDRAASVAFVGDVNGDSHQDIAIGAPAASIPERPAAGAVSVIFGPIDAQNPADLANLGTRGYRISGRYGNARTGRSIAALGDYDNDGYDDFAIGAPGVRVTGCGSSCAAGAVYIVRGSAAPVDLDLRAASRPTIAVIHGVATGDDTGFSLARLGDAQPGLIIGAPSADPGARDEAGSVFVLPAPLPRSGALSLARLGTAGYRIDGPAAGGQTGFSVSSLAVPNAPADVVIGAPTTGADLRSGAVYVVRARPTGSPIDLALPGAAALHFAGAAGEQLGWSVAGIGDLSGDDAPEIAMGAPTAAPSGRRNAGRVYVAFGRAPEPLPITLAGDGLAAVQIDGASTGDVFGRTVAPAPDLDGDPYPDLLVGAPLADPLGRRSAGATYGLLGFAIRSGIDTALLGRAGVRIAGQTPGWQSGRSLAASARADKRVLIGNERLVCKGCLDAPPASPVALVDAPGVAPPPPRIPARVAGDCTEIRDIEVIVDSSKSMGIGDAQGLRRAAIELLLTKPRRSDTKIGVLSLRSAASQVFPTISVGPRGFTDESELAVLRGLLDEHIGNDFGTSDYLLGLAAARRQSPGAGALILITDASDSFADDPLIVPGLPRIYVLALRSTLPARAQNGLERLAVATGGRYVQAVDGDDVAAALNLVDARLDCELPLASSTVGEAPAVRPDPDPGTPAPAPAVIANTTLTGGDPASGFVTALPPERLESASVSVTWKQPAAGPGRRRPCLDTSAVLLRTLRVYDGKRVIAHADAGRLRAALSGDPTRVGALQARGRCGRGVLALTLTGFTGLAATPSPGIVAATVSPSRISLGIRLRGVRKRTRGKQRRVRPIKTSYSASAKRRRHR